MKTQTRPVIFFDGVCSVCNQFIDFILKRDANVFLFASLQGDTARAKLNESLLGEVPKSIVLWDNQGIHVKSQAIFRILFQLGWQWKWMKIFTLIPTKLLDLGYDYFAARRYRWFGKKSICRIPTPQERDRFLT